MKNQPDESGRPNFTRLILMLHVNGEVSEIAGEVVFQSLAVMRASKSIGITVLLNGLQETSEGTYTEFVQRAMFIGMN